MAAVVIAATILVAGSAGAHEVESPYHYVHPPASTTDTHHEPLPGRGMIPMTPAGSVAASVGTGDAQATVSFEAGAFRPMPGQKRVLVTVTPLDPGELHVPPPPGLEFAGNAYEFAAEYLPGGIGARPAPAARVSIVLSYPNAAESMLRLDEGAWVSLQADDVVASRRLSAPTDRLGTYVASDAPSEPVSRSVLARRILTGAAAVVLGGVLAMIVSRRSAARARRR